MPTLVNVTNNLQKELVMGDEIALFRSYIAKKGLRNTPEREEIISEIFLKHDHFDIDELYLRLRHKGSKISKA